MWVRRTSIHLVMATVVLMATGGPSLGAEPQYVGHAKCKVCHLSEHKTWLASAHSKALEVLKPEDRTKPECLGCHTTGYGRPAAAGADLSGVQCEACHGPGSLYKTANVMSKSRFSADRAAAHKQVLELGLVIPDEKTCTGCHNPKSPTFKAFDFTAMKEKIKHWK